jgi:hypothetical protein
MCLRILIFPPIFATLLYLHLYLFDNASHLLPRAVGQPAIARAVPYVLVSFPTGRALPKKFFGSHVGIVVFVVRDLQDELIDLDTIVVHGGGWGVYPGNC